MEWNGSASLTAKLLGVLLIALALFLLAAVDRIGEALIR